MSSPYPTLGNKPIDQWKVTALKDELKRRKLTTKGLKEDLVKRLSEAIWNDERELEKEEIGNGSDPDPLPNSHDQSNDVAPDLTDNLKAEYATEVVGNEVTAKDNGAPVIENHESNAEVAQEANNQDTNRMDDVNMDRVGEDNAGHSSPLKNCVIEGQDVQALLDSSVQELRNDEIDVKTEDSNPVEDAATEVPNLNTQVSEVNPVLGIQVQCESISADSVSINEKNELKDNLNADDFPLELEVNRSEMVQPSPNDVPITGDLLSLDDKGLGENQGSVEDIEGPYVTVVDMIDQNDSGDGESPEKLNLDQSSGDESPERDLLESKPDSRLSADEVGNKTEASEPNAVEEKRNVVVIESGVVSPEKKNILGEKDESMLCKAEKRKGQDQEVVGNTEIHKRQRRWNSESIKVPEPQTSNIAPSFTPRDALQSTPRHFGRSDSTLSADTPKERVVPPSQKTATTSLRIDRFVRPFTLKAVQELLGKTGNYSSVEEATETRNALYNLQWPPNGGRLLIVEFVDPQEVKTRLEAPLPSPAPVASSPTTPSAQAAHQNQATATRQNSFRQQLQDLPPPPPILPPPPSTKKKQEDPPMTLDDLFRKTRATPRIYYLPLSEEQVAAKLASQNKK
ncbi:hypothetical protein QJS04_geneDACA020158 [Acorus gramineus]|uniref:SAP domain-containing protein n=1 Tax=Acorus gramineus TaxID=55184 RepID=A0AAV9BLW3_ACOGR|nr:hypothetical protein QJS04_geneDACA020158 [Acorus gramineus]